MNEILFFVQTLLTIGFVLVALRLGQAALTSWIVLQALLSNLFVFKQITLFGFHVTASDIFAIGSLLGINLLQEYFSDKEAYKTTRISFVLMLFFVIVSKIHLAYLPSPYDNTQAAFELILAPSSRLLIASILVFFIVQQVDIWLFTFFKKHLPKQNIAIRAACSLSLSQLLDTSLFTLIGLYGLVASLLDIIIISFLIKLIAIFCITPLIHLAKK